MPWQIKQLPAMPESHRDASSCPGCSTFDAAPCNDQGKASVWAFATMWETLDEAPGSRLWPDLALATATIWEENQ